MQVQQLIRDHDGQGWYPQAEAWRDYQEWRMESPLSRDFC
jgi:hypothetical protein